MYNYLSFYYDPLRQGYDTTLFKTLSGTPATAVSGGTTYLKFNEASSISYLDLYQTKVVFRVNVPAVPTAGDNRAIGLAQMNANCFVAFFFDPSGKFYARSSNNGAVTSVEIPWNDDWTAADVDYEIRWHGFDVYFYINGVQVALINSGDEGMVTYATSLYLKNANTDDMLVRCINVINSKQIV